jgi:hypothetical protein
MKLSMFRRNRRRRQTTAAATALNENESIIDTSLMTTSSNSGSTRTNCNSKHKHNHNNEQQRKKNQQQHHRNSHRHPAYDNLIGDNNNDDDFVRADDDHYYNEYRVAEVGQPRKRLLKKVETMRFKLHDFANCEERRGQYRITPTIRAHGYNWKLQIYPYGDNRSSEETEHVSCFLHYFASPNDRIEPSAKVTYRVATHKTDTQLCAFSVEKGKCSTSWGLENFIKRKKIIEKYLDDDDGSLTIEIDIQIAVDRKIIWYPTTMRREPTLTQLYLSSSETGDVTFRVPTTTITNTNTNTNTNSSDDIVVHQQHHQYEYKYYKAHKMILALRAKILYELVCEESSSSSEDDTDNNNDDDDGAFVVDLPGIDCETFETMLEYVYTVKRPLIEDVHTARNLLVAADRFCLTELKLYVESVLADKFVDETNAAELLLFADSHSCALLKETTMDVCLSDPNVVMKTPGWKLIEESDTILTEVFEHTHTACRKYFYNNRDDENNNNKNNGEDNKEDACTKESDDNMNLDQLDVFSLRERLDEADLDVDGSRETLIGRLEELSKTETTSE